MEKGLLYTVYILWVQGDALQANGTIYMEIFIELDGGGDTILGHGSLFAYKVISVMV